MKDAFYTWKRAMAVEKSVKKKKEEIDFELDEKKSDLKRLERRINEMEEEIEESDKRYNHLYSLVKDTKKKISLYENKGRELSQGINQILDKVPKVRDDVASNAQPSQDRIISLQNRLSSTVAENKELKSQMEMTQSNVTSFIQEMNNLISSHEINQMVNMEGENEQFEEESGGGSRYVESQREDYPGTTKKYTPPYHTSTQGGATTSIRSKKRTK